MKRASAHGLCAASVKAQRTTRVSTAIASGMRKTRLAEDQVTRRQASSGPIPVKSTSRIASGVVYLSNQGAASELLLPVKSSEISGKKVPQAITTSSRPAAGC